MKRGIKTTDVPERLFMSSIRHADEDRLFTGKVTPVKLNDFILFTFFNIP